MSEKTKTKKKTQKPLLVKSLTIAQVIGWFESPSPEFMSVEEAISYILSVLLTKGKSYPSEMLAARSTADVQCSDTILYRALAFLIEQKMVIHQSTKAKGRGRPREVYQINPHFGDLGLIKKIAGLTNFNESVCP